MNTERGKVKRRRGGKSENRRRVDIDKDRQRDGQTDKRTDRRQKQIDRKYKEKIRNRERVAE